MTRYIKKSIESLVENLMDTNTSNTWWDSYRHTIQVTHRFRELVCLVGDKEDIARDMISLEKQKYPGKNEIWYLNKLIANLKQDEVMGVAY